MKINSIVSIMKKSRSIQLFTASDGTQWVANLGAAYPLYGMPRLDEDSLRILMDLKEDGKHVILEMKNNQRWLKVALIAAEGPVSLGLSLLTLHLCCMCMQAACESGKLVLLLAWVPLLALNTGCIALVGSGVSKILERWKNK